MQSVRGARVWLLVRPLLLLLVAACSSDGPHVVHEDIGGACVHEYDGQWSYPSQTRTYAAHRGMIVHAGFGLCSYCDKDQQAWCAVQRDGYRLHVDTLTAWIPHDGDCVRLPCPLKTTCELWPLSEGTYEVVFGASTKTLVIPSTQDAPFCISSR